MNKYFRTHTLSAILSASLMLALPWLSGSASAGTVSAPYVNDFSASVADFVAAPTIRWTHLPVLGVYSNEFKSTPTATTASVNVSNMGGPVATAKPFTYTTNFKFLEGNGTGSYVGVCLLSGANNLPAANGYTFYQVIATPSGTGKPLFLARNNVVVASGTSFMQLRFSKGTSFRYEVKGVYVDTDSNGVNDALDITAKIINPANGSTATLTYRDTSPLTGAFFGMKSADGNSVVSAVNWDAFSVSNDTPKYTLVAVR